MRLVNLTPHAITLIAEGFAVFDNKSKCYHMPDGLRPFVLMEFPSEGIARCAVQDTDLPALDVEGTLVPCCGVTFGAIEGLPDPVDGTMYIVSAIVANAARAQGRRDVVVPARMVRDAEGKIIGCLAFAAE